MRVGKNCRRSLHRHCLKVTESLVRKAVELALGGDTCRQILVTSEVRRQPLELAISRPRFLC
jgi:hypothetical protein